MRRFARGFSVAIFCPLCVAATLCTLHVARANPAVYEPATDPGIGFNLIAWSGSSTSNWTNAINALYAAGFREVSISPVRSVQNGTGIISQGGYPPLTSVRAGVERASQLGMRVTLNPFVEVPGLSWRAYYNPTPGSAEADTFWPQYQSYLVSVAQIAEEFHVASMNLGTEMKGLDQNAGNAANWSSVIDAVDATFQGQLGYAANWDSYQDPNTTSSIWENPAIDYIGIDSYFSNTLSNYYRYLNPGANGSQVNNGVNAWVDGSGSYPDESFIDLMTAAWNYRLDTEILPFAAARKDGAGMPVAFTEVGYQNYNRTAKTPQGESGAVDSDEQKMAFYGLIRALDGRKEEFQAMHIWQWWMSGSDGSTWNIDPTLPANQPQQVPIGQWLSGFVQNVLPGDFNGDGVVDAADYTTWRNTLGQSVLDFTGADGDGSGLVDAGDYDVWKANFGATLGGGSVASSSVPEPAASVLLLVALCGTTLSRWRRVWFV